MRERADNDTTSYENKRVADPLPNETDTAAVRLRPTPEAVLHKRVLVETKEDTSQALSPNRTRPEEDHDPKFAPNVETVVPPVTGELVKTTANVDGESNEKQDVTLLSLSVSETRTVFAPPIPDGDKHCAALSEVHILPSQAEVPKRMRGLIPKVPKRAPTTKIRRLPVPGPFVNEVPWTAGASYVHDPVDDPIIDATLATNLKDHPHPADTVHNNDESDVQMLLSHALLPTRTLTLYPNFPKFLPRIESDELPVVGPFVGMTPATMDTSKLHIALVLPNWEPEVTHTRSPDPAPADVVHSTTVSDNQTLPSHALSPTRPCTLNARRPNPLP